MWIPKCDKCGKLGEETMEQYIPKTWRRLDFSVRYSRAVRYLLCGECSEALKLPEETRCQEVGEQLIELMGEIAVGVREQP